MNKMFVEWITQLYDIDTKYSIFYNDIGNINDIEVEHYYFLFRETIHWYDMSSYK